MAEAVPASEFTRNFGRYRMLAQREAVAVTSHGQITGYFVRPDEFEEFMRFKAQRSAAPSRPPSCPTKRPRRSPPRAWMGGTII